MDADTLCNQLAPDGREMVAWLSDDSTLAIDRLGSATGPWVRRDNQQVLLNRISISESSLEMPIELDETGEPGVGSVWTGTNSDISIRFNCDDWNGTGQAIIGDPLSQNEWTASQQTTCVGNHHIYCFELAATTGRGL